MKEKLKILHLEDFPSDAELVERELKKGNISFEKLVVDTKKDFEKALKEFSPDLILSDHSLPSFNSIEAFKLLKATGLDIPFILVTSTMSEEYAVEMMKLGISDYILKDRLKRLPNAVINAIKKNISEKEREEFHDKIIKDEIMMREAQRLAKLGSIDVDFKNDFVQWSDELYKILGFKMGEIEPSFESLLSHVHPEDVEQLREGTNYAIKELDFLMRDFRLLMKDGAIKYVHSEIKIERDKFKNPIRLKGFNQDITDRILLENKLAEEKLNKQKEITHAIINSQEKERAFLAEELHDNINQILAASKLYLDFSIASTGIKKDQLQISRDHIVNAMEEIRKLSKSLLPPSLEEISLQDALSELLENIQNVNELNFIKEWENIDEVSLSDKLRLTIFRIVQEQLNNIIKHAKAKNVIIGLIQEAEILKLSIKDDGIGFDTAKKKKGVGLKNIINRASLFNGNVIINSHVGEGCELEVNFNSEGSY